jgi:uncharacterized protein
VATLIVFADTFYYLALLNAADDARARAVVMTRAFAGRMVTIDWVLTELADGLSRAATRKPLAQFLRGLLDDPEMTIVPANRTLFERGFQLYCEREDKNWSLTDCVSFVVMTEQGITDALTADHHFEQAGFMALLK